MPGSKDYNQWHKVQLEAQSLLVYSWGQYWSQYCLTSSLMILDDGTECTLGKLGGGADRPDGCAAILRHLDKLERSAKRNLMEFNGAGCGWDRINYLYSC
ncbi:hypothetical protein QYF61_013480 [Mycteria americana]|uniref:Uncharacterized protein n=1 Tax=Mycteria americana TaxID=33587 RepID=A0AAN7S3R6_MYCAM|nr:hypothetical protein QYF61_013480 [Mycteria americana]